MDFATVAIDLAFPTNAYSTSIVIVWPTATSTAAKTFPTGFEKYCGGQTIIKVTHTRGRVRRCATLSCWATWTTSCIRCTTSTQVFPPRFELFPTLLKDRALAIAAGIIAIAWEQTKMIFSYQ